MGGDDSGLMTDTYEFTVLVKGTRHWAKELAGNMEVSAKSYIWNCRRLAPNRTPDDLEVTVSTPRKVVRRPYDHKLGDDG